ncbi:serine/threonine-protein kinase RsbW [Kutzneria viridogrisea]|uniref:Serine/threonine-protein kinase RsbW n=1 Tax=Kutzneria viridogrisea TaxID=47990 RepID=A0ABR6BDI4_9PSEU|nr:ATP-binding protein [Kutzneria albida]MBA8924912.1 serine/threonine-protein kinase RsbW [Kutzneria viridogrisea]
MSENQSSPEIEVRIAARPDHLSVLRAVAADLAMRADFDLDAISDLKMAVDEACATLISRANSPEDQLVCGFAVEADQIHFTAHAPTSSPAAPSRESFGWRVLSSLTDSANTWVAPGDDGVPVLRVDLVKKRLGSVGQ